MRVLLVEDERRLAEALRRVLEADNYAVDLAHDGRDGLYQAQTGVHDLLVLDVMLPGLDGISLLQALRDEGVTTPVLMLSAKGRVADKVLGLDSGADDYLAKPFQASELLARLRALSRRREGLAPAGWLAFADIELDPLGLELRRQDRSFRLTRKESQLLEVLMANAGHPMPPASIIQKVWGYDAEASDGNVQTYVSFLRKKLGLLGSKARIETIRGVGYRLEAPRPEPSGLEGGGDALGTPG